MPVLGVIVAEPTPPTDTVYHTSDPPPGAVAVRATAAAFWQYDTGLVTKGDAGVDVTVIVATVVLLHPDVNPVNVTL